MSACEMCGAGTRLVTAIVEGVEMQVCKECSKYGNILKKPVIQKKHPHAKPKKPEKEVLQLIVSDFDGVIRKARERLKLNQKEFAAKLNERESIIQKIETKDFKPSIALAEKLEKQLGIKLIETVEVEKEKKGGNKSGQGMTIGDLIKLK